MEISPLQSRERVMSWYDSNPEFWNTMEAWLPKIERFEIFGGEPFLIKRHFDLLKKSIAEGHAKNQTLHYNTNGTVFPEEVVKEVFPQFKEVKVMFSLDGTGEQFEYQRFPAKWETSLSNLQKFKALEIEVEICLTLSALNIFYLTDYLEFWHKFDIPIYLNVLDTPVHYNFQIFPAPVKQKILEKLSRADHNFLKKNVLNAFQPVIDSITAKDMSEHFPEFIKTTKKHDEYRKQSYKDVFPEFYDILRPYFESNQ
jgi:sulfatase maturation enzyme AslB (radical SAM superfamily)